MKNLVFLTMPIDSASEEVALQIEYLWQLKAALSRDVTIAVIVSLIEEPLGHLERYATRLIFSNFFGLPCRLAKV